ncbi:MAG TPA: hypothetical protein PKD59_05675 [Miltoncostaeaceae bacterium]|nr:hypothetical protein [Miltoncostaeaceae bacterium]
MTPLAPAVFELRTIGLSIAACGVAGVLAVGDPAPQALRAGAAGLAGSLILLWLAGGARAARRAARLALPVAGRWRLEGAPVTVVRVLVARTLPAAALAAVAAVAAAPYVEGTGAAAAGALLGAGASALLAAQRVRQVERVRGRRLLHATTLLRPLGRNSLFLEPAALADRPGGRPVAAPWPSHRPPQRTPRAAIELEPANGPAFHGAGVRPRPAARVSAGAAPAPRDPAAGG